MSRATYCIRGCEVLSPAGAQRRLPTHVPEHKLEVLVLERLGVGSNRRRRRDDRAQGHLIHECRFARIIQSWSEAERTPEYRS